MGTVLGISGFARARAYHTSRIPDLDSREKVIHQGADAAAALVKDDLVVAAAAQERYDGVKHSSSFPTAAVSACLAQGEVDVSRLDLVAHSYSYREHERMFSTMPEYYSGMYREVLDPTLTQRMFEAEFDVDLEDRFVAVPHHIAHAASSFVPSGFSDALVVVSDGLAEINSTTVFRADHEALDVLGAVPGHSSLGSFYGLFTLYLGFWFGDGEYKVMGLAPYGSPDRTGKLILRHFVELDSEGRYYIPLLLAGSTPDESVTFRAALRAVESALGPRRAPDGPITQWHMDIAAGLQQVLELLQMHQLRHFAQTQKTRRLCLAGGVALNCVSNSKILSSGLFDEVYVQPAAGDDGAALGAALYAAGTWERGLASPFTPYLGDDIHDEECRSALSGLVGHQVTSFAGEADLAGRVAQLISQGAVVGLCRGRMEFGPRALGNRSIVADPGREGMRDRINSLVKLREGFRPFAPAVLAERAADWFDMDEEQVDTYADMLFVAPVRPEHRRRLPAITHVDGSARVQTVSRDRNELFWQLLRAVDAVSGVPMVLNTSFNVAGQPVVRDADEAVRTYVRANLDALVLGDILVTRVQDP